MNLLKASAKAVVEAEAANAGMPLRGVHIRPDGTQGMASGARYVDLAAPDRPGWTTRVRDEVEVSATEASVPDEVAIALEESPRLTKAVKDEIKVKKPKPEKAEKAQT